MRWDRVAIGEPPLWFERRQFTSDAFYAMGPLTIVPECAELFDGVVTDKTGDGRAHCWTHEQYAALVEAGILDQDERIELVEGEIVRIPGEDECHGQVTERLAGIIRGAVGEDSVRIARPLWFNRVEQLRPDVILLRDEAARDHSRPPAAWDALLVAEVSGTTLEIDRELKSLRYARSAIPEYWIADLGTCSLTVHLDPVGGNYRNVRTYAADEAWCSSALGGYTMSVERVFGRTVAEVS